MKNTRERVCFLDREGGEGEFIRESVHTLSWAALGGGRGGENNRFFDAWRFSLERFCLDADKLIVRIKRIYINI